MALQNDAMKLFGTLDFYTVLGVQREGLPRSVRQAGYMRIMEHYGTRRDKCRVVYRILCILTDDTRRLDYDRTGNCTEEGGCDACACEKLLAMCDEVMKMANGPDEINNAFVTFINHYQNSRLEAFDVLNAYLRYEGCMSRAIHEVPLVTIQDEMRMRNMIRRLISRHMLPHHPRFFEETATERRNRHRICRVFTNEVKQFRIVERVIERYGRDRLEADWQKFKDLVSGSVRQFRAESQVTPSTSEDLGYDTDDCIAELDPNALLERIVEKYGKEVAAELKRLNFDIDEK